jgi:hypothetical protein
MEISRSQVLDDLKRFAINGNGVVIGRPGVGKTYLLLKLHERLSNDNVPHLLLPIDKIGDGTNESLQTALSYKGDLIIKLRDEIKQGNNCPGILLFDAFDAARNENTRKRFFDIIQRTIEELKGLWNVIVSVRTYDAKRSQELLDLFGKSIDEDCKFYIEEGISCRHFAIPLLTDSEINQAIDQIPQMGNVYQLGSNDFKELLRIPFNIWLLEKILISTNSVLDLSQINSETQLLGEFWMRRIRRKPNRDDREFILKKATQKMVDELSLSVYKSALYSPEVREAWAELLSDEILSELSSTGQRISFSHNILFDYAVSVLLIEDNLDSLSDFISEDQARLIFLHPSLTYYLTRLWYDSPDVFWDVFWHILSSPNIQIRLFARLIPTAVIANEARAHKELNSIIRLLAQGETVADESIPRLLHALRVFRVERDELWIGFLEEAVRYLRKEFVWDLSTTVSEILERSEKTSNDNVIQICGGIGRQIFEWVWKQREEVNSKDSWLDRLCAYWIIPVVAKTFKTDPHTSGLLLNRVLDLVGQEGFPVQFVYRLAHDLDRIWSYDAEFAAKAYRVVFGYYETSEEKVDIGAPVLPMTSTRSQEYRMCQYLLIKHFPNFLRNSPVSATRAMIDCLNYYVICRHIVGSLKEGAKLDDLPVSFQFRGKMAHYVMDVSYIWDESEYRDEPIEMADEFFKYIIELPSLQDGMLILEQLLDIFCENVWIAFFWRRLLNAAAQVPEAFAKYLFELCIAWPIQTGSETLRELGLFLEAAACHFTDDQIYQIECSILNLPNIKTEKMFYEHLEWRRDRLLARIPAKFLKTEEAKKLRKTMESSGNIPNNEPLVSSQFESRPYSEDEWLRNQGAEPTRPENQELQKLFTPLGGFEAKWRNEVPTSDAVALIMTPAKRIYEVLINNPSGDEAVVDLAWTKLASCLETIARAVNNLNSEEYDFCKEVLLICAKHRLPKPNPEYDSQYNTLIWSPFPRTEAAMGLTKLAAYKPDLDILNAIDKLVHDKVTEVRALIIMELYRIIQSAPDLFWSLARDIASNETNQVVQKELCRNLEFTLSRDNNKTVEILDIIFNRMFFPEKDYDLLNSILSIVIRLYIVYESEWANHKIDAFIEKPLYFAKPLKAAVSKTLLYITPENFIPNEYRKAIERTIDWLYKAIDASAKGIKEILANNAPNKMLNESEQEKVKDLYDAVHQVVSRIHQQIKISINKGDLQNENRKYFYFQIKPLLEKVLAFASSENNGLLFAPTAHDFMEILNDVLRYDPRGVLHMAARVAQSSKPFGYNADSLAVREVVNLVESILADYRSEVREGESLRDLLNLLDVFAEAGWPEALKLVWRLDEIFR